MSKKSISNKMQSENIVSNPFSNPRNMKCVEFVFDGELPDLLFMELLQEVNESKKDLETALDGTFDELLDEILDQTERIFTYMDIFSREIGFRNLGVMKEHDIDQTDIDETESYKTKPEKGQTVFRFKSFQSGEDGSLFKFLYEPEIEAA